MLLAPVPLPRPIPTSRFPSESSNTNVVVGDFVLPGIAHCIRKNILIFNTSPNAACPVQVVPASNFGRIANTNVSVCLAYYQSHYEPLVPSSSEDIAKTIFLATQVLDGSYNLRMKDIPLFEIDDQEIISVQSHFDKEYPSLPTKALNKTIVKKSIQNKICSILVLMTKISLLFP